MVVLDARLRGSGIQCAKGRVASILFAAAVGLQFVPGEAENWTVFIQTRLAVIACIASVVLSGPIAGAQSQDRDTRGIPATSATAPPPEARVDINHASVNELLKVPGLTPPWAGRIVRFRPYRSKADLVDRGIVSDEVYDRIKDYVIAHREKQ